MSILGRCNCNGRDIGIAPRLLHKPDYALYESRWLDQVIDEVSYLLPP